MSSRGGERPECPSCKGSRLEQQLSTFAVGPNKSPSSRPAPGPCGSCGDPRDLHYSLHSFPTRRSSDLSTGAGSGTGRGPLAGPDGKGGELLLEPAALAGRTLRAPAAAGAHHQGLEVVAAFLADVFKDGHVRRLPLVFSCARGSG